VTVEYDNSLAPNAARSSNHGGRVYIEPDDPLRDPFALDRHRIIESTAFRRLEGKTQVFAPAHHDHFRTRLTHTLEASVIARTIARALRANETLAEAITLAHDLGHPPFGHAGETALADLMTDHGGFNHNAHSVRVVEYLEHPFPPFRGLNLTRATLAGLRAHATRYDQPENTEPQALACAESPNSETEPQALACANPQDAQSSPRPNDSTYASDPVSIEAQIASVADRVAYDCHDLEDAIGAGFVSLESLSGLSLWKKALQRAAASYTDRSIHAIRRVVLDAMLDDILHDVIQASLIRLSDGEPRTSARADLNASTQHPYHTDPAGATVWQQLPAGGPQSVSPSPQMDEMLCLLETFLLDRVYRHPDVQRTDQEGQAMIDALFAAYLADHARLPDRFARRIDEQGAHRVICDYIAGMTDRFCKTEHERLMLHRT
jgi:dGTPase